MEALVVVDNLDTTSDPNGDKGMPKALESQHTLMKISLVLR